MALLCAATTEATAASQEPTTLVYPPWKHNLGFNRFRQFHLTAYGGYGRRIGSPQGIATVKLRSQDDPGTGDDDEVTVYAVNGGENQIVYNTSLVSLGFVGDAELGKLALSDPVGIAVDPGGMVVVADRGRNRLVVLRTRSDMSLVPERAITLAGSGRPLSRPCGVAMEQGTIYVADSGNDRVAVADSSGTLVRVLDRVEDGAMRGPFGVAAIAGPGANFYDDAFVAVTDSLGQRLTRIDLAGHGRHTVLHREITDHPGRFGYVAIDYYGNVWVTDSVTQCVYKFDHRLRFLTSFECAGDARDELDEPRGIAIHRQLGQVFIAENTGVSYYWVGTDVLNLTCRTAMDARGADLDVRFTLTERSLVSIDVTDADGNSRVALSKDVPLDPGLRRLRFRLDASELPCKHIADCKYRVTVRARATYASRKYLEVVRSTPVR